MPPSYRAERRGRARAAEIVLGIMAGLLPPVILGIMLLNGGHAEAPGRVPGPGPVAVATPVRTERPVSRSSAQASTLPTPDETAAEPSDAPAAAPTEPPTPVQPQPATPVAPPSVGGPARAVRDFYDAVEDHDWDAAIALWSPSMRERYPPDIYLIDRFRPTTRIDISQLDVAFVDRVAGRAGVSVTLVEYRSVEPSPRTFVGGWDLNRIDGRWVLNDPDF